MGFASYYAAWYVNASCNHMAGPCISACSGCAGHPASLAIDFCHYKSCHGTTYLCNSGHNGVPVANNSSNKCPVVFLGNCAETTWYGANVRETDTPALPYKGYVSACGITPGYRGPLVGEIAPAFMDRLTGSSTHNLWTNTFYGTP